MDNLKLTKYIKSNDKKEFQRLYNVIHNSGLETDAFTVLTAIFRHTKGKPDYIGVHYGLHRYFMDVAAGGGAR